MTTPQMKAQYAEFKSIVQREFQRVFNQYAPTARCIKWHDTFFVGKDQDLRFNTSEFLSLGLLQR